MSTEGDNSTAELLWQRARYHYENHTETVKSIAEGLGLTSHQLVREAKARGWTLRKTKGKPLKLSKPDKAIKAPKASKTTPSTQATLQRVKGLLQNRLTALEEHLQEEPAKSSKSAAVSVSVATSEREIRAMNTLVRTMEKVLELERKDQARRHRKSEQRQQFDDAARLELAARIEKIQEQSLAGAASETTEHRGD